MRRWLFPLAGAAGFAVAVVPALAHDESVGTTRSDWTKKELAIAPGHKVTIENTGGYHDLHWSDGAKGVPEPSVAWTSARTFAADDDGKAIRFRCTVHNDMVGTVHVNSGETVPEPGATTGDGTTTGSSTTTTGTTTTGTTTGDGTSGGGGTTAGGATDPAGEETPPADRTAPRVSRLVARVQRRRLVVRLRLDEAARVTLRVTRARRSVARGSFRARAGANRLALRRSVPPGSLRVRVVVTDRGGNATRRNLTVRG